MSRVLVVDDEKTIVKGIKFALEMDGMEVDCAYDGEEALSCIKNNKYDVVLLDLMLPKMDGYTVCSHVREFSDVPIILPLRVRIMIKSWDLNTVPTIILPSLSIFLRLRHELRQLSEEILWP